MNLLRRGISTLSIANAQSYIQRTRSAGIRHKVEQRNANGVPIFIDCICRRVYVVRVRFQIEYLYGYEMCPGTSLYAFTCDLLEGPSVSDVINAA